MTLVKSSNITGIDYNTTTQTLVVLFKNDSLYHYEDVPRLIYDELLKSESIGSTLASKVKGKFNYKKVEVNK